MVEKAFLTDSRRDVLEGNADDLTEQSLRNAKSRIRVRARLALAELIEVAESEEIDQTEVFEPDDIAQLLQALLTAKNPDHIEGADEVAGGLISQDDYTDDFRAYSDRLQNQMGKLILEPPESGE
jgi:hypothetical protein